MRKGFLLLEVLVASSIICITGISISQIFSREIDMTKVIDDYETAQSFVLPKIVELETEFKKCVSEEELLSFEASGDFSNTSFKWTAIIRPGSIPFLYELHFLISGLRKNRELEYTKWYRFKLLSTGDEDEETVE